MKFTVLMSVYVKDDFNYLNLAIDSIYNSQILKPNQVVIVCDGPLSDMHYEILNFWRNKHPLIFDILYLPSNLGLSFALNYGIQFCKYEYVARMDSDDISHPNRFLLQIDFLKNNSDVMILGTLMYEFENNINNIISKRNTPEYDYDIKSKFKYFCPISHPTVVFNKNIVLKYGGYKNLFLKEDLDLWLRLLYNGVKFHNLQHYLFYFRFTNYTYFKRGGIKYALSEIKLINYRYQIRLNNLFETILLYIIIIPLRLSPYIIRKLFYKFILR